MWIALALLLAGGCAKQEKAREEVKRASAGAAVKQSAARMPDAAPTPPALDAAPAAPVADASVAPVAPGALTYASIEEFLGLAGAEPPDTLAGFKLGDPATVEQRDFIVTGFGKGWTRVRRGADGKIRHVIAELMPIPPDTERDEHTAAWNAIADAQAKAKARWGKPSQRWGRQGWRGKTAQLFTAGHSNAIADLTLLVVDLLPAGDAHVCGARDGFGAFHEKFAAALKKHDGAAILAMLDPAEVDDMGVCGGATGEELVACIARLTTELDARKEKPVCNLSLEVWWWRPEADRSSYFSFRRKDDGTWWAYGPHLVGHDDGPDTTSP